MSPLSSLTRLLDFLYSLGLHKSFVVVFISYFSIIGPFFFFLGSYAPCTLPVIPCTRVVSLMLFLMKYLFIPKMKMKQKENERNSKLKLMVCLWGNIFRMGLKVF